MSTTPIIHYLTRCTRVYNLKTIESSIYANLPDGVGVKWHILFDSSKLSVIPTDVLSNLRRNYELYFKDNSGYGMSVFNSILSDLPDNDWFYILDDDNIVHGDFYKELHSHLQFSECDGYLFNQYIGGKDFTGLDYRIVDPNEVRVQKIDSAQFLLRVSLWRRSKGFGGGYRADGEFIEELYNNLSERFKIVNKVLSYYNYLEDSTTQRESKNNSKINTLIVSDYLSESSLSDFNLTRPILERDDSNIQSILRDNDIGSIVTLSKSKGWEYYINFNSLPHDFRMSWVHIDSDVSVNEIDDISFKAAMHNKLNTDRPLISIITPAYNTGVGLLDTYKSLLAQTYFDWEWIIVNDSTDGDITQKVIDSIVYKDNRVKCYRLSENSKGNIGFVKYFGFSMSSGGILVELDHDDYLFPFALQTLSDASKKYKGCGFFYSDCIEYDTINQKSLEYPVGWAFGYGSYYDFTYDGKTFRAASCPNINPKTIRHIVSSPNHVRAWTRDFYFSVGGHNKRLKIADDYELMVRSFLHTRICKIAKPLYIQNIYGDNTTEHRRADIQNKVWYISSYYNEYIKFRFDELGVQDWAFIGNPANPLAEKSKFGISENYVNYIYNC